MSAALARAAAAAWILAIVGTLAIGALGSGELRHRVAADGPACPFRAATGQPCAFCGLTHATLALGRGELGAALDAHPLAPVVIVGMVLLCGLVAIGRADVLLAGRRPALLLVAIAVVWVVRLVV